MSSFPIELQAARMKLSSSHPYLSSALWRLQPVRCPEIVQYGGHIGADQYWRVYFDPEEIVKWDVKVLSTVLYHEVMHLLRNHASRARGRNAHPRAWNIAADAEINDDLAEERLPLPEGAVFPKTIEMPDGRLAEEYYNSLIGNVVEVKVTITGGNCGSCADGEKRKYEGDSDDAPGVTPLEAEIIRQGVAQAVQEHKKSRGTVPGHWDRWAEKFLSPPKVPWQKELASHLKRSLSTMSGRVDYTYSRPSRRQSAYGRVVMPSLRQPCPMVGVVVDTSGSMGEKDLEDALSEVKGILMSVGQRNGVDVMAVDAAVHTTQKVFDVRQVKVIGGGGTDMREGLSAMAKRKPRVGVVVVLTDGYTPWPTDRPPFDVIIGLIGGRVNTPPWARTVIVE